MEVKKISYHNSQFIHQNLRIMRGIFKSNYTNPKGQPKAIYIVKGTEAEIAAYKEAVETEDYTMAVDETTGQPLHFADRLGKECVIKVSESGYVDCFNAEAHALTESINMYADPGMKAAMQAAAAQAVIARILGGTAQAPAPVAQVAQPEASTPEASAQDADLS